MGFLEGLAQGLQGAGDVGLQGLGTILRIVDLAAAAKRGGIGQALLQQSMAAQDPEGRAAIAGSPLLAGFTGTYGHRIPASEAGVPSNISILGPQPNGPTQFQADLPPLNEAMQLKQLIQQYGLAKVMAEIPNLQAQTRNLNTLSGLTEGYARNPNAQGSLQLRQIGPSGATFAPQRGLQVQEGTLGPGGAYKVGDVMPSGEIVSGVRPRPGAGRSQAQVAGQLRRIAGARNALQTAFGPQPDGTSAIDLLPSARESTGAGLFRTQRLTKPFTSAGEVPGFFGGTSIPRLARQGNRGALALTTGTAQRSALARSLGEVGNLAVEEQKVVEVLLPSEEDTKEIGAAKVKFIVELLNGLEAGLSSGQIDPDEARATILNAAGAGVTPTTSGSTTTTIPAQQIAPADVATDIKALNGGISIPAATRLKKRP